MKRVLSVQDLSCVGKCSLTVALPVLSAMGCACSVLPTAVLSTHTAFPDPHVRSLTADLRPICDHLQAVGAEFDAVCVGYLSDPDQVRAVAHIIDTFGKLTVLDPAMGDHGRLYSGMTRDHVEAMKVLCRRADVLLPNVTEAAFLTGLPCQTDCRLLLEAMEQFGARAAVITGVSEEPGMTGFVGKAEGQVFSYSTPALPRSFHGTGDLFAAVLTGALMAQKEVAEAARLAAGFVERCIANTPQTTPFGIAFEDQLPYLWET